jgi:methylamine---glutamate N-methyltransferase subunit C
VNSKITTLKNGPLKLVSMQQIISRDGAPVPAKKTAMLCTCGHSRGKPFCDGAHAAADFTSERRIDAEILQEYPGKEVTVYFNRSICSGAGSCVRELPTVFKSGDGANWIFPDNDSVDKIIERVKGCPSGALAYSVGGEVIVDERVEETITIIKDGPYNVEGVALERESSPTHCSGSKYSLCRCGYSKNKPYCDYSHAENSWHDSDDPDEAQAAIQPGSTGKQAGDQPVVADNSPVFVTLNKGEEYYFCTCGRSQGQPYCDGSHAGTSFVPEAFTAEEDGDAVLCACKATSNLPHCDGSHSQIPDSEVGRAGKASTTDSSSAPVARPTTEEPTVAFIHQLAKDGLSKVGHHGPMTSMGVPRHLLPHWDDIQIMTAQMATKPLMEDQPVGTGLVIGPEAKKPLHLNLPLFVSDMSFGALSEEAKIALARGAELAGTGICSGEGGMLPEEQAENSRYFYELASAQFGYSEEALKNVQAFHFKGGQGAKTGTGGHLPGQKNTGKISQVRGIPAGEPAVSPPTFKDMSSAEDFKRFADRVRDVTGGIPIGFKLSANHIEADIQFALDASADYIILDGRGGGTGAAPEIFRDHISVPTIPALGRARRYLDKEKASGRVTLLITGGLRTPIDFVKALALGADGIGLSNSALQAIGCVAARICNSNNCPAGIATQKPELRKKLDVLQSAARLQRFLGASVELMQVMARACGHSHFDQFCRDDLATWNHEMARLSGVNFSGFGE